MKKNLFDKTIGKLWRTEPRTKKKQKKQQKNKKKQKNTETKSRSQVHGMHLA